MSKTRIYAVTRKTPTNGANTRLVRASQAGPALSFVAKDEYSVDVASQDDLVAALKAGVQVENEPDPTPTQLAQVDVEDVTGVTAQTAGATADAIL
jgi:hypothetical protein